MLATSLLCAPLITFCSVLVRDAFHEDVGHFSLAMSALGAGGLAGAVGLLFVSPARDRRPVSTWFGAGYGGVLVLTALDPWASMLPVLFVLAGIAMAVSNVSANGFLQSAAPEGMRGRTVSLYMLAMRGGIAIGSLATGITISAFGVREALLVNGVLALAAQAAIGKPWARAPLPASSGAAAG